MKNFIEEKPGFFFFGVIIVFWDVNGIIREQTIMSNPIVFVIPNKI